MIDSDKVVKIQGNDGLFVRKDIEQKSWKISDPTLLYPPDNTHPNCRCRLLLKDSGEIFSR